MALMPRRKKNKPAPRRKPKNSNRLGRIGPKVSRAIAKARIKELEKDLD